MRFGFPFYLKKRGQRSTASDRTGRWGELLVYLLFLVAGGLLLAWHVGKELVPDWQARRDVAGLRPAICRLVDKRIATRDMITVNQFRAEFRFVPVDRPDEWLTEWTHDGTAAYSPSRDDAQQVLERYEIGKDYNCWIDPEDPTRILLDRGYRWWPWVVVLIPASLMIFGAVGCVRTLRQWNASEEWQAVSEQMSSFDIRAVQPDSTHDTAGLPSIARVLDSPGVRLAHRLPIDGSPNWRLAAMAAVCLCWNALVVFFVQQIITQFQGGTTNWLIAALVVPFAVAGAWLIVLLVREAWNVVGIGTTHVEITRHPLHPGGQYELYLLQSGQMHVRLLTVSLLCEERAVFQEGTDTREWIETVHREVVLRERNFLIESGTPYEAQLSVIIPETAMHSFRSDHNEVRWLLEVHGVTQRWPEFHRRFPVYVYPAKASMETDSPLGKIPELEALEE